MRSFLRSLQDKKKSISQPEFCSIPSLNGKSAKKSQMFFKIVFTKLSSIVGLYCLQKVSTIWWAQSDHACLALLARFTLLLLKKREKVTFVLQAKRGSAIAFWRRNREKFGGSSKIKVPRARPREQQSNARSPFMWSARTTPRFEQVEW